MHCSIYSSGHIMQVLGAPQVVIKYLQPLPLALRQTQWHPEAGQAPPQNIFSHLECLQCCQVETWACPLQCMLVAVSATYMARTKGVELKDIEP